MLKSMLHQPEYGSREGIDHTTMGIWPVLIALEQ
jgi:hypothetical protein